ncbi:MAG: OmpA family protein [Rhodospirillales bacterium]|nr:OmpA family protein [Rhodospirillales bacterium]
MNPITRFVGVVAGLAMLGACSIASEIDTVRRMPVKGDAFQQALHAEYVKLATIEDEKMVADGKKVDPTAMKERKIPKNAEDELEAARIALVAVLRGGGPKKAPAQTALAQAMFDCWMEEQEENNQPKDIALCRNAFDAALKRAEAALAERPAPTTAQAAMPTAGPYVVYFAFNSAKLDAKATATINEAAAAAKSAKVSISGHTDRAGANDYNMRLSRDRANAVAAALVKAGVAKANIARSHHGEERPAVATEDGKKEPRNRRVEITVK